MNVAKTPDAQMRAPRWLAPLGVFALLFFVGAQVTSFAISAPERDMGNLQKIIYVHLPAAWNMMVAYIVVFLASVAYLWKRREAHDLLAASAAEVGVVLTGLTLALGSIWARPTWGVWWTWDPRLTSTAILFLIFVGYLSLRSFVDDDDRRARWSAAVGIFGFLNVPIVYMSVRWWRTLHQVQSSPETVDSAYALGIRLNAIAFLFLMIFFMAFRYQIARLQRASQNRQEEQALTGGAVHV